MSDPNYDHNVHDPWSQGFGNVGDSQLPYYLDGLHTEHLVSAADQAVMHEYNRGLSEVPDEQSWHYNFG
jgi:hypothetical protein